MRKTSVTLFPVQEWWFSLCTCHGATVPYLTGKIAQNEAIKIPIQHGRRVWFLISRPKVLHHLIWLQNWQKFKDETTFSSSLNHIPKLQDQSRRETVAKSHWNASKNFGINQPARHTTEFGFPKWCRRESPCAGLSPELAVLFPSGTIAIAALLRPWLYSDVVTCKKGRTSLTINTTVKELHH